MFRLDADVARPAARGPGRSSAFEAAPAGVLVGTQMVAKGHDFPDVSLGVVLDADQTLRFPDFRAEERTFALVTQLAGRVGRGGTAPGGCSCRRWRPTPSRSRSPRATTPTGSWPSELVAAPGALATRRSASLIRIVCSAEEPAEALDAVAAALHGRIAPPGATVLGPAPLFRLRGRARSQLVIKAGGPRGRAVRTAGERGRRRARSARRGVSVSVDVDPQ